MFIETTRRQVRAPAERNVSCCYATYFAPLERERIVFLPVL